MPLALNAAGAFSVDLKDKEDQIYNSQTVPVLVPVVSPTQTLLAFGGPEVSFEDDEALLPGAGFTGVIQGEHISSSPKEESVYVVRPGETISEIAEKFKIKPETIRARNDIGKNEYIRAGQELQIPPVDGAYHKILKGDTLASIAKKYGAKVDAISSFNDIKSTSLVVGKEIFVPGGVAPTVVIPKKSIPKAENVRETILPTSEVKSFEGWVWPVLGGVVTQGYGYTSFAAKSNYYKGDFHGGVDIAAPRGTSVLSAKSGTVTISDLGYNGGYGNYIEIDHLDGTKTRYGHNTKLLVKVGQDVVAGQVIATVGSTGRATGPHVHFEIRDSSGKQIEHNPFYDTYRNY